MGARLPPYRHKPSIEPESADAEMAPASQPTWDQGCLHIGTNRALSQHQQMPRWPQPASQYGTKAASIYRHKPSIEPESADAEMAPASQPTWDQGCLHIGTNRALSQNQQMPRWPQPASQHIGTNRAFSQNQQMPNGPSQPANMGLRLPPYRHKPCIQPASATSAQIAQDSSQLHLR